MVAILEVKEIMSWIFSWFWESQVVPLPDICVGDDDEDQVPGHLQLQLPGEEVLAEMLWAGQVPRQDLAVCRSALSDSILCLKDSATAIWNIFRPFLSALTGGERRNLREQQNIPGDIQSQQDRDQQCKDSNMGTVLSFSPR